MPSIRTARVLAVAAAPPPAAALFAGVGRDDSGNAAVTRQQADGSAFTAVRQGDVIVDFVGFR
ncbi:hypothetical protein CW362_41325 [Streptomyces populi]|uniref:Uncharacterized protein n=1 Tax=Streptomyces populi TaxID=2058924 RepID=A0A2I0SBJ8_9ACTN|nr:hypothetical protein [Streptomyces populi]PKT67273.1 hypothetical protein CW362_41325 [Streptomyces populi]